MSRRVKEKNKVFAGILALFFGGFGVHKFYLRDPGAGILYLFIFFLFTTRFFPISYIMGWIDAIRLFSMSQEAFDKKYNKELIRQGGYDTSRSRNRPIDREKRTIRRTTPGQSRKTTSRVIQQANPFKKSGLRKYKEFDLNGAIEDFREGLKINPNDIALHFNLACAYSLTEKKEDAFYHLSKAVALGYNDFDNIQNKDDLAYLRIQPEFEEFKNNGYVIKGGGKPSTAHEGDVEEQSSDDIVDIKDDVLLSQLNKLAELRKKGLLTEDEFTMERKKLLRR